MRCSRLTEPDPNRAAAARTRRLLGARPSHRSARFMLAAMVAIVSCASIDSARYVQARTVQANLNDRATEALAAGLIDAVTAKRVLAISEAISVQTAKYRTAVSEGESLQVTRSILAVIERLLRRAELFLPAPELLK